MGGGELTGRVDFGLSGFGLAMGTQTLSSRSDLTGSEMAASGRIGGNCGRAAAPIYPQQLTHFGRGPAQWAILEAEAHCHSTSAAS